MIPSVNGFLAEDFEVEQQPSLTYKMHINDTRIVGKTNELESVKQTVYKILNTERYQYIIYSWDHGVELADLFGESTTYVIPELERRITEALVQDDRILNVDSFSFETERNKVHATFMVHTVFGDFEAERTVTI